MTAKTPDGAVAWQYRFRESTGLWFDVTEAIANHYARLPEYETRALIPAASLDAMRGELEAERLASANLTTNLYAAIAARDSAESKLAAVGALADSWYARKALDGSNAQAMREKTYEQCADELRTLIADAGTGDNDNSEVTK